MTRIMVQSFGLEYYPERCPCSGEEQGDGASCQHTKACGKIVCLYEDTEHRRHIDPPANCPLLDGPAAMIVEARAI